MPVKRIWQMMMLYQVWQVLHRAGLVLAETDGCVRGTWMVVTGAVRRRKLRTEAGRQTCLNPAAVQ